MANVAISATAVKMVGSGTASQVQYGETVTHGQVVYFDTATNRYKLASADTAANSAAYGIALTPGANGDYGYVARTNVVVALNTSSVLVQGRVYVLSSTPGALAPETDLTLVSYVCVLGVASSDKALHINIFAPGYIVP